MAPRKGLLVDFGGVLTTNIFESFSAFCDAEGLEPETVRGAFRNEGEGRDLLFELELGRLSDEDFERRFCAHLGLAPERAHGLIERLFGGMRPDRDMEMAVVMAKRQVYFRTIQIAGREITRVLENKFKVSYDGLLALNHIDDPRKLKIGQRLLIPEKMKGAKKNE